MKQLRDVKVPQVEEVRTKVVNKVGAGDIVRRPKKHTREEVEALALAISRMDWSEEELLRMIG